jgi:hypothetical protein
MMMHLVEIDVRFAVVCGGRVVIYEGNPFIVVGWLVLGPIDNATEHSQHRRWWPHRDTFNVPPPVCRRQWQPEIIYTDNIFDFQRVQPYLKTQLCFVE